MHLMLFYTDQVVGAVLHDGFQLIFHQTLGHGIAENLLTRHGCRGYTRDIDALGIFFVGHLRTLHTLQ